MRWAGASSRRSSARALSFIVKRLAIEGLGRAVSSLDPGENPALVASAIEFILEGLHLNKRLNKDRVAGKVAYRG